MSILEHWAVTGGPEHTQERLGDEIVFVRHRYTGLALLVAVPDHDGGPQVVTLQDPARDVVIVSRGSVFPMKVSLDEQVVQCGPHSSDRVTFIRAGTRMVLEYTRDCSMLCVLIVPAGRLAAMRAGSAPLPGSFGLRDDAALAERVHAVCRLVLRQSETDNSLIEQATSQLAQGLGESLADSLGQPDPRIALPPHKLRRVLAHIDANLDRPITLRELAGLANLSPYHFTRVFKHATGRSPYDHVRWRRITRSTALVARSELKIAEISASTGFASAAHFSSAFQRAAGIPPLQFRRVVRPRLLSGRSFGSERGH